MPTPTSATFERLRGLTALESRETLPTRDILEAFTAQPIAQIEIGTAEDVAAAMKRARAAQADWAEVPVTERAAIIKQFADLVYANLEALIDMAQCETGKARQYGQEEVLDVALTARWYAKNSAKLLKAKKVSGMLPFFTQAEVQYQPKGVVGVISPWNYPITLAISDALAALMAGNAIVIKPDSQTPYCALAVVDLLYQAGLPRDLVAVVPGPGGVVGTAIVESADYVMFTGSSETGATLAAQCGARLIGFSAELGGKNPLIVLPDADVPTAVEGAVRACYSNSGQLCISIERIYVHQDIAAEFTAAFAARVKAMTVGASYGFDHEMGSLASKAQVEAIEAHVNDALAQGATLLAGGKRLPELGPLFYAPTVLTDVPATALCYREETFGPLVSIYPVAHIEEAIAAANDTDYGLNASVFGSDPEIARAVARRIKAGTVNINEGYAAAWGSTAAPMGGMGKSGIGRRHGPDGLLKYTESQTIARQRIVGIDGIKGVPRRVFLKVVPATMRSLKFIGR